MQALKSILATLLTTMAIASPTSAWADRCFGAVGMQCGSFAGGPLGGVALCVALLGNASTTYCEVSGGSWNHDTCCAANQNGRWCAGPGSAFNSGCTTQWNQAVNRFTWGYHWARVVDGTRVDNDGQVNRAEYCATNGSGVHKNDVSRCCSGNSRSPNFFEWVGRPNLRICRS